MPRVSRADPEVSGQHDLLAAVRNRARSLREKYHDDPIGLAEKFGLKFPRKPLEVMRRLGKYDPIKHGEITPGLRELIEDVCSGSVELGVAVANRGGGKSQGVSFIEFFLVFIKDYDALNLGGSELQAQGVYNYLVSYIEADAEFRKMVKGETKISETHTIKNAWVRVLTASQKSVRSPHAGGRKRDGRIAGGILVIDEEAEADPDIVEAARYTVNTALPSVTVRASTFHNAEGSFREVIDNAEEMGYKIYRWDIFDVAQQCDCVGDGCQSAEKCFREDHWEEYIDPETGAKQKHLVHRAYCGGRAMYADGWIPMREIEKLWKGGKRNHSTWEVEAMGSRPTTKKYVIKDQDKFIGNAKDQAESELYVPGYPVTICVDWGTHAAGIEVWQAQDRDRHALIHSEQLEEAGATQTIGVILKLVEKYRAEFEEVAADIGGGGNYNNLLLRDEHRIPVRDVVFSEIKETAVAAMNIFSEAGKMVYSNEAREFKEQMMKWRRKDGRIVKKDDHMCDTAICYFSKFIDRLGLTKVRIPPRAASSNPIDPRDRSTALVRAGVATSGRAAVIRTIGSRPSR